MPIVMTDVCLFDLDGTLVDTQYASHCAWSNFCSRHNMNANQITGTSRPWITREFLMKCCPSIGVGGDEEALRELEYSIVCDYLDSIRLIPGAKKLLMDLNTNSLTGNRFVRSKWAIVTSGSPYLAHMWFRTILREVGAPEVFITASDVTKDKPDPEGYRKACLKLCHIWGCQMTKFKRVVFEDSPKGIRAGKSIGATVIAVQGTYPKNELFEAGADYVISDLTSIHVKKNTFTSPIILEIEEPLTDDGK